jgi:hypothetical protein
MPEDGTGGPAEQPTAAPAKQPTAASTPQPTAASTPQPAWWRRHKLISATGGVALIAAAGAGAAIASASSGAPPPTPAARAYATTTSVLAAMDSKGAVCSGVGPAGAFMDCSGASSGDTVIGLFRNHADAMAYADGMVILGLQLRTPTAEVVGPNWVVNTSPTFAADVVAAIGGQIVTKANAQPGPAAAWPADVISGAGARG